LVRNASIELHAATGERGLDPVFDGVLDQGEQGSCRDARRGGGLVDRHAPGESGAQANRTDRQVVAGALGLVGHRRVRGAGRVERVAQQAIELGQQGGGAGVASLCEVLRCAQGVEQEVGLDLRLQSAQLGLRGQALGALCGGLRLAGASPRGVLAVAQQADQRQRTADAQRDRCNDGRDALGGLLEVRQIQPVLADAAGEVAHIAAQNRARARQHHDPPGARGSAAMREPHRHAGEGQREHQQQHQAEHEPPRLVRAPGDQCPCEQAGQGHQAGHDQAAAGAVEPLVEATRVLAGQRRQAVVVGLRPAEIAGAQAG
jgi:hypothetical protein